MMAKRTRRLVFPAVVVVGIFVYLLAALFSSEIGSSWLIRRLASSGLENLTIKEVRGNLLSRLSLYEVSHDTDHIKTRIEHVEFEWRPMSLLRGELHISNLRMKGVSLSLPSSATSFPIEATRLPDKVSIPVPIFLDNAALEKVDIHQGGKLYEVNRLGLSVRADKNGIRLEMFKALGKESRFNFKGNAGLQKPYPFEGNVDWFMIAPGGMPVKGECYIAGDMQGGTGTLRLAPPFDLETSFEFKANEERTAFSISGDQKDIQQPLPAEMRYPGEKAKVSVNQVKINALGGSVTLNGLVNWQAEPVLDLLVHGKNIVPSLLFPDLPGELGFQFRLQGRVDGESTEVILSDLKVLGRLLDLPFESSGSMTFQDDQPRLVDLNVHTGRNRLKLSGDSEKSMDLLVDLEVLEPEILWPGVEGQLRGKGSVRQIEGNPVGALVLEGTNLAYGNFRVENYQGNFTCASPDTRNCEARVKLTNLQVDSQVFPSLAIDWMGDLKKHRVQADLLSSTVHARLDFEGECYSDTWKFRIDSASFDIENNGPWNLSNQPVNVLVDHSGIKPFKACWAQKESNLCVDGSWSAVSGWKTEGDLNAPPLNRMLDILKVIVQRPKLDKSFYKSGDINYK